MAKQVASQYNEDWKALLVLGDIYMMVEDYAAAKKAYDRAYDLEGSEHETIYRLARVNSKLGNHDKAMEQIEDAIDDEDLTEYQVAKIDILAAKGEYSEARNQADRILRKEPNNVEALKFLGDIYHRQRVYDVSKSNYEKLLEIDPNFVPARLNLAEAYYWLGQRETDKELGNAYFKKSLEEYAKVVELEPTNTKALFEEGKILFYSNQFKLAASVLSKYAKLEPEGHLGRWYLAQSFVELGACDSASSHLANSIANIDSVSEKASLMQARCYYDTKNYKQSRAEFEKLMASQELDINDRRRLATSLLFTGDTTQSIALYKELILEAPDKQCQTMETVGRLLIGMKQYEDAIWFFEQRINNAACKDEDITKEQQNYYYMGLAQLFSKMYNEAKTTLEKAVEMDPTDNQSKLYLADAYVNLDDEPKSIELYKGILVDAKADPEKNKAVLGSTYAKLAGNYQKNKDYATLGKLSKEWSETFPENEYAYIYLGISYQASGNIEEACKAYRKAAELNPNLPIAKKLLKDLGC
ncbi:MAG: hypothetical protein Kapaf2KO_08180 [Candidatus Kapaibacteriales bacterium]